MHLRYRNVNDAFRLITTHIRAGKIPTVRRPSRAGEVLQIPEPVIITYCRPYERVLFNIERDCNPFFHLYESLWMLAGRNDVRSLTYYNSRMQEFSDDGYSFNSPYGERWRRFEIADSNHEFLSWVQLDQLQIIADHLKRKPESRRCVLQIWDVQHDLLNMDTTLDNACNTQVYFALNYDQRLDMTVCNRSNDLVWGALGANVVHFSMMQEYMAIRIGVSMGVYNQFSNNLHCYTERWEPDCWLNAPDSRCEARAYHESTGVRVSLVSSPERFDEECREFVERHSQRSSAGRYEEPFLEHVAQPMCEAFHYHKERKYVDATMAMEAVQATDWRLAGKQWLAKRQYNWEAKHA